MAENAKWYVVHTYSGYENTVAASIMKAAENRQMQDLIRNSGNYGQKQESYNNTHPHGIHMDQKQ